MIERHRFKPPGPLHTPVLFLVYKRPDTTKRVFEAIRQARPSFLYVAADGPKEDIPGEAKKVQRTRDLVLNGVDWECEVKTLFRDKHLGCKYAVSGGINWFFENEEFGIILEDDTLPSQSFFWFCQDLLAKYRRDNRVMAISGDNFQDGHRRSECSYYFSKYNHCWGWAAWRTSWAHYDQNMTLWPYIRDHSYLYDILLDKSSVKYWSGIFDKVYNNLIDTWDYRWTFSCWVKSGLTILPNVNLVSNIGFTNDATHTKRKSLFFDNRSNELSFPLRHPDCIIMDRKADKYTQKTHFNKSAFSVAFQLLRRFMEYHAKP